MASRIPTFLTSGGTVRPAAQLPRLAVAAALLGVAGCGSPASQPTPATNQTQAPRGPVPLQVSSDPWVLSTDTWQGDHRGAYLGNGFLGQRATQSGNGLSGSAAEPAYLAGLYQGEALAPLPPLTPVRIQSGGRTFGAEAGQIKKYHQELRLKEGLLVTTATWDTGAGEAEVTQELALLRQQADLAVLRVSVKNGGKQPVNVSLDGTEAKAAGRGGYGLTRKAGGATLTTLLQSLDAEGGAQPNPSGYEIAAGGTAHLACVTHAQGGPVHVKNALRGLPPVTASAVDGWLRGHRAAWAKLWRRDIEIAGDPEAQQVVRTCLFHLLSSTREENDAGIPPMGLSANAFNGHVFWDMDSWMFPALLPQHPELAKAMLEYRFRTLDGARANAKAEGLPGASYAWESASTGKETIGGEFSHGRHVTGDVALALQQYSAASGDSAWLRSRAWPILKETAENWVARAKPDGKGGFVFQQVTTPDELAGKVDYSAWTQFVARRNLELASGTARALGQSPNPRWATVAAGLNFEKNADGVILAHSGFKDSTKSKQADALLLVHPGGMAFSQADLGKLYDFYAPRVIQNGPAMTDAIHAIVAARLGRGEESLTRFQASYRPFLRPPYSLFSEKRSKDNLCFHTGEAGVVEAVLYGFAGLQLEADHGAAHPKLDPHVPPGWQSLKLHQLQWHGKAWDVELKPGAAPAWTAAAG